MSDRGSHYDVGYGKPPMSTRFRKGRSGNPNGRGKAPASANGVLNRILKRKVYLTIDGKRRRVPVTEAVLLLLSSKAMGGDPSAIREFLRIAFAQEALADSANAIDEAHLAPFIHAHSLATLFITLGVAQPTPEGGVSLSAWLMEALETHCQGDADEEAMRALRQQHGPSSPDKVR